MAKKVNKLYSYTQNRDISWLRFNQRVLEEAHDSNVPLFERLKFAGIFSSNLDEFFMIRIGSLLDIVNINSEFVDWRTGRLMSEQVKINYHFAAELINKKDKLIKKIFKELDSNKIKIHEFKDLIKEDKQTLKHYFKEEILPLLSPQVIDFHHPFPNLQSKNTYVGLRLKSDSNILFGLIPIPKSLSEIIKVNESTNLYIRTSDLVAKFSDDVFSNYSIKEKVVFDIIRNADINSDEDFQDDTKNIKLKMKEMLAKRKRLRIDLIEYEDKISDDLNEYLKAKLDLKNYQMIRNKYLNTNLMLNEIAQLNQEIGKNLFYPKHQGIIKDIYVSKPILELVKESDQLLFYPYESISPFIQMIKQAADDPKVSSIKITIYRLARNAKLVEYLSRAAENGKEVIVIMELKARFDEQNNIDFSERLEEAGCRIIYGVKKYKIHSKVCLITIKDGKKLTYISQFGTGNYNEKTSEIYSDLSLITSNQEIGEDTLKFFNSLMIDSLKQDYKHLLVAPNTLKSSLLSLINDQIQMGDKGYIQMKFNSITDQDIINALVKASQAGVKIDLNIRSSCCLLPGVPSFTENIKIVNIVGQFLEHARIFVFGKDNPKVYIGSADMMSRNTSRRVEVLVPILSNDKKQLIIKILESYFLDNTKIRQMDNKGNWIKPDTKNKTYFDAQQYWVKNV